MLTIKHVDEDGRERVVSVESVSFDRRANCLRGLGSSDVDATWTSGHAYVMNDQGKTVAVYNLSMNIDRSKVAPEQIAQAQSIAHRATKP